MPAAVQYSRHVQGSSIAGHVSLAAGKLFSISGNLATQFPQAVGWAMAAALKGEDHLAAGWIGEGAARRLIFTMRCCSPRYIRRRRYSTSSTTNGRSPRSRDIAGGEQRSFAARGPGYGIAGIRVDGNDFLAVHAVTEWAAQRARTGAGPTLIELVTYRAAAHSTSDDPARYRAKDDQEHWPLGDPIERLKQHLIASANGPRSATGRSAPSSRRWSRRAGRRR